MADKINLDVAQRIAEREKCPNQLALVARIRELEADRDSWAEQASQRVADWEREHELRIAAERRVSEMERKK